MLAPCIQALIHSHVSPFQHIHLSESWQHIRRHLLQGMPASYKTFCFLLGFPAQMVLFENRSTTLKMEEADVSSSDSIAGEEPFSCLKNNYLNAYTFVTPSWSSVAIWYWSIYMKCGTLQVLFVLSQLFPYLITWKTICQQHLNVLMKEPTLQNVSDHCTEPRATISRLPWLLVGKHPTIFFISTLSGKSWWGAKCLIKGEM